jgi:hypothetical protein
MEGVVHGIPNIIVFIGDLLLYSDTQEEALKQLNALLSQPRQQGIKINLPKCEFGSKEVAYLGFRLTESAWS